MTTRTAFLVSAPLLLALAGGCATRPNAFTALGTTKFTLDHTDRFMLLDQPTRDSISCTGLQASWLPDGRLEVMANVKNRENRRVRVQVSCMFKDEQGFPSGEETPIQTVVLAENFTEVVRFTAPNANAKRYTVRVRQVR